MPTITVRLDTPVRRSFRVAQVAGMLDVPLEERLVHWLSAEVPGLDEPWTIGVIVGPSGSGKSTLARSAFGRIDEPRAWPAEEAIIDGLAPDPRDRAAESGEGESLRWRFRCTAFDRPPVPTRRLARVLVGVGLGSVPTWLKPYAALSTGERFRADLARTVVETSRQIASAARLMVIDEFGSSLDRTIAQTTSGALARLLRKDCEHKPDAQARASRDPASDALIRSAGTDRSRGGANNGAAHNALACAAGLCRLRLVVLTCRDDIVPWLAPDWVLRLGGFGGPRLERGRPEQPPLNLRVERVPQAMWACFAPHHYLSGGLAASATCYAAWIENAERGLPVAFCAVAPALGRKKTRRISRLVTRPEFQGLGLGSRLMETVAEQEAGRGNRVTITASHPAILSHCSHSPRWRLVRVNKTGSTRRRLGGREVQSSQGRAVAAFEFLG